MKLLVGCVVGASIALAGCVSMQEIKEDQKTFSTVTEVPGVTGDRIYANTKMWIAETFRSAKAVIEYDSAAEGTLIGGGGIAYPCQGVECMAKHDWSALFTMRIDVKDGKFRATFSNIRIAWPASGGMPAAERPIWAQGDLDSIKPALLALPGQLAVRIKSGQDAKKDW